MPMVMMDYAFVRRQDETEKVTILLMKDRESRAVRAWTMRNKGVCYEEAAGRALEGIKAFGHTDKILVKVDNDPSLVAHKEAVTKLLGQPSLPVVQPAGESTSKEAAETGREHDHGTLRRAMLA